MLNQVGKIFLNRNANYLKYNINVLKLKLPTTPYKIDDSIQKKTKKLITYLKSMKYKSLPLEALILQADLIKLSLEKMEGDQCKIVQQLINKQNIESAKFLYNHLQKTPEEYNQYIKNYLGQYSIIARIQFNFQQYSIAELEQLYWEYKQMADVVQKYENKYFDKLNEQLGYINSQQIQINQLIQTAQVGETMVKVLMGKEDKKQWKTILDAASFNYGKAVEISAALPELNDIWKQCVVRRANFYQFYSYIEAITNSNLVKSREFLETALQLYLKVSDKKLYSDDYINCFCVYANSYSPQDSNKFMELLQQMYFQKDKIETDKGKVEIAIQYFISLFLMEKNNNEVYEYIESQKSIFSKCETIYIFDYHTYALICKSYEQDEKQIFYHYAIFQQKIKSIELSYALRKVDVVFQHLINMNFEGKEKLFEQLLMKIYNQLKSLEAPNQEIRFLVEYLQIQLQFALKQQLKINQTYLNKKLEQFIDHCLVEESKLANLVKQIVKLLININKMEKCSLNQLLIGRISKKIQTGSLKQQKQLLLQIEELQKLLL